VDSHEASLQNAVDVFQRTRPRLFGVAYRVLGTAAEAEDVVQDAWLRWQTTDRNAVKDPTAFLVTTTTRLALNVAQSARAQRETYIGPWLPEPVDTSADPYLGAERGEALSIAVLLLLEKLNPVERAAYVLREAFAYSHREIADLLDTTEGNARQLASRAQKHVANGRHASVSNEERDRLLHGFIAAAQSGEVEALERLLAEDVVSYSDGGGIVTAARVPLLGRTRVAQVVAGFHERFWVGAEVRWSQGNGQSSALVLRDGLLAAFISVEATTAGIQQIHFTLSPVKLRALAATL